MSRRILTVVGGVWALMGFWVHQAEATFLALPPSVAHDVLSETVPTAFAPEDFAAADYVIEWVGGAPPAEVEVSLGEKSLEWVRVMDVLAVPRARLRVRIGGASSGIVTHAGFTTPFSAVGESLVAEVPVALISSPRSPVELQFTRGSKSVSARLQFRFQPQKADVGRVFRDPSCSRFGVDTTPIAVGWAYVGCRLIVAEGAQSRTPVFEMYVFWDGVGSSLRVNGAEVPESSVSLWALRLASVPGKVHLEAAGQNLQIAYRVAEPLHLGFMGVGIGPYQYEFAGLTETKNAIMPMLTLYGSYFITETLRLVAFDATVFGQNGNTDFGIYLNTENMRFIDKRLGINLLLGGHVLAFQSGGSTYIRGGFPQGAEVIYTDAFGKGKNFSLGGFLYPLIDGKSYSNVWIRWGGAIFGELNYISFKEMVGVKQIHSKSLGITVGFPLARFL